jgi:PAS domain S-box-containing protein
MRFEDRSQKVIQDISVLYELSLAIGQSLDLTTNCDRFLKTLMARKNLGDASVWIKGEFLADQEEGGQPLEILRTLVFLVYANPKSRVRETSLPPHHPIFSMLDERDAFSISSSEKGFSRMITERGIDHGTFAVFKLGHIGFLKLFSLSRETPFEEEELNQLKNVISKFAVSLEGCIDHRRITQEILERILAEEVVKKLARENAILAEIGRIISSSLHIERVYDRFAEEAYKLIPFDGLAVNTINLKEGTVTVPYVSGTVVAGCHPGDAFQLSNSVTERVLKTNSALTIQMVDPEELKKEFPTLLTAYEAGLRSVMVVPLISKDRGIGALHFRSAQLKAYSEQDVRIAENIASQIAGAIASAQLFTERDNAENALKQSEQQYRNLVEVANDVIFTLSDEGEVTSLNPAFEKVTGWSNAEWIGKSFASIIHPDDLSVAVEVFQRVFQGEMVPLFELRVLFKSGEYGFGEFTVTPQIEQGRVMGVLGIARDITERKQAERALKKSKETLRMILDGIDADIYIANMETYEILFMNKHMKESFGGQLVGEKCWEAFRGGSGPCPHCTNPLLLDSDGNPTPVHVWEGRNPITNRYYLNYDRAVRWIDGRFVRLQIATDITDRKRSEELLQASEANYRAIFDTANDAIFIHDIETGKILDVNSKMCEMYGYTAEEARQINVEALSAGTPPYTQEDALYRIKKAVEGTPQIFDWMAKDKAGRLFWVEVNLKRVTIGGEGRLLAIVRDISERKRTEGALTQSEEQYRTLVEESFDGIFIQKGVDIIFANRRLHEMLGYEHGELEGREHWIVYHPDYQALTRERAFARLRGESPPSTYEVKFLRKDGISFWGEIHAKVVSFLGEPGIQVWAKDISERKQAEQALRESEERYRMAIESSNDGVAIVRKERHIYVNKQFVKMFGYETVEEVLGQSPYAWIHPDDRERVMEFNRKRQRGENVPTRYETKGIRKNGEVVYLEVSATRILLNGEYITLAYLRDITELKLAEETLRQTEHQLRQSQKMEAVGRLAGGVAHDFNNLLTVIKGYSELSLLGLKDGDPFKENIEEIYKASERAANLTRQLLAFSRKQILDFKVLNLNTLIRDLDKMLHRILGEDIELVYKLAENPSKVKTDPGQIEQVILNLAVNARDAMPSGGNLTIQTGDEEIDKACASTHTGLEPGRYTFLSITDTGVGMTPEVKERLFEPFFTTKEKGKGTGLGLSTVYGIIKQSSGHIEVESAHGLGTTFKIYLPRVEEEEDPLSPEKTLFPTKGTETILLVEDDPLVRELSARILRDQGYQLFVAADGEEAIHLVRCKLDGKIHLLFTDVVMPKMSGKELAEWLKGSRPEVKVLFASGYTDDAIVNHGILDKTVNFIQKPFTPEALARKVREVLDR